MEVTGMKAAVFLNSHMNSLMVTPSSVIKPKISSKTNKYRGYFASLKHQSQRETSTDQKSEFSKFLIMQHLNSN